MLNVDRELDVLAEAVDQPMGLGERGAALEAEALRELLICPKDLRGPDHPDVLLQQLGRPAGFCSSHRQPQGQLGTDGEKGLVQRIPFAQCQELLGSQQ